MRLILVLLCGLAACVDTERLPSRDSTDALDAGLAAFSAPRGPSKPELAAPLSASASAANPGPGVPGANAAGMGAQPIAVGVGVPPSAAGAEALSPGMSAGNQGHAAGRGGAGAAGGAGTIQLPSTSALPMPSRIGELVITELMIDPKTLLDSAGEWFELYNPNAYELDLRGCEIDDGSKNRHELTTSIRAPARRYVTIARQSAPGFVPDGVAPISLGNTADSLAVRCAGVEIDRVSYDKAAGYAWTSGASLALDAERVDARENDSANAWCSGRDSYGPELGTPGRGNPACDPLALDAGVQPNSDAEPAESGPEAAEAPGEAEPEPMGMP